jgi:hypothetical protein
MRTADRKRLETETKERAAFERQGGYERRGLARSMIDALEDILRWERSKQAG